jgi:hypothetical protein
LSGSTPRDAHSEHIRSLQQVLNCITRGVILTSGYRGEPANKWLELGGGQLVPLAGRIKLFGLQVQQRYMLIDRGGLSHERWKLAVTEYRYTVASQETGHELVAFHWHPRQIRPPFPHVHLETGLGLQPGFVGLHVPTG